MAAFYIFFENVVFKGILYALESSYGKLELWIIISKCMSPREHDIFFTSWPVDIVAAVASGFSSLYYKGAFIKITKKYIFL